MSVRRGPADEEISNAYDEFEIQTVTAGMESDTGNAAVGSNQDGTVHSFQPLGGLARNEVAELVGLHENFIGWTEDEVAAGHAEGGYEVSMDSTPHLIGPGAASVGDELEQVDDHIASGVDALRGDTVDPDILRLIYWQGASESSAQVYQEDRFIPYRMWYGRGPTFDRHDEIFYHGTIYIDDDFAYSTSFQHTFIWDVFTEE